MATIKDVARIAGVSVSTVSHVVNGTRYVSPEKVRKVEDAIRQLDELPNFIAKRSALKSKLSERDRKSTRLNSSHRLESRMPSSA